MSNTNGISANRFSNMSVTLPSLGSAKSTESLTPDALMFYCQTRLKNLDTQITDKLREQRTNIRSVESLNSAQAAVTSCMKGNVDGDGKYEVSAGDVNATLEKISAALSDPMVNGDDRKRLQDAQAALMPFKDKGGKIGKDTLKGISDNIDSIIKERNSAAELNMIGIQSLMSQRQTAIQLTTNMMSAINDSLKSIAGNTKG